MGLIKNWRAYNSEQIKAVDVERKKLKKLKKKTPTINNATPWKHITLYPLSACNVSCEHIYAVYAAFFFSPLRTAAV